MPESMELREVIRETLERAARSERLLHDSVLDAFKAVMDELARNGLIDLQDDYKLAGWALEIRVAHVLRGVGFAVQPGRRDLEDYIVPPPSGMTPERPLVVEVKSGKQPGPDRESLRQLDDWVFDLSGEEHIRKGKIRTDTYWHKGVPIWWPQMHHPTPHKGLLIYNGPVGTPFGSRPHTWLGENERAFAEKRNFCVVSLPCLLTWYERAQSDTSTAATLWHEIHSTGGILRHP